MPRGDRAPLRFCADIAFASVGSPDELKARRRALASKSYSTMLQAESSDLDALLLQVQHVPCSHHHHPCVLPGTLASPLVAFLILMKVLCR